MSSACENPQSRNKTSRDSFGKNQQGSLNRTHSGGIKQYKRMVFFWMFLDIGEQLGGCVQMFFHVCLEFSWEMIQFDRYVF